MSQSKSSKTDGKEVMWKKLSTLPKPKPSLTEQQQSIGRGRRAGEFNIAVAYGIDGKTIVDFKVYE